MQQKVFIVDDDPAIRDGLAELLCAVGFRVEAFASGEAFLAAYSHERRGCLLLDISMPGLSGLQVQTELNARGLDIPVVFLSAHGDIALAVEAMRAGALDFMEKPVSGNTLIKRVNEALHLDRERHRAKVGNEDLLARRKRLTPREREVMALVVAGLSSKAIARELGLSHRTIEVHRTHIMQKMGAQNVPELVKLAARLNSEPQFQE